jgi:uncharacterized membrane protein YcgQ (UPF0703/DUF1980 family)
LVGFVAFREGVPADEFMLTRLVISCCSADALGVSVRVVGSPPGRFSQGQWVRVTDSIDSVGAEVVVDASQVVLVPRPANPYLNP